MPFWAGLPRVVGCQDGVERQRGEGVAAFGLGVHLVGLVLARDGGLAGMALGAAWMLGGRLMPPQGC